MDELLVELQRQIDALKRRLVDLETQENEMAHSYGWIGGAWQKDPLREGYSGDQTEQVSNLSAAAGTNTLTSTAVPAGEIWKVQAIEAFDSTSAPTGIFLRVTVNGVDLNLVYVAAPAAGISALWSGEITLSPGDTVKAVLVGCTLNDDIYMKYHAVRVDIDQ